MTANTGHLAFNDALDGENKMDRNELETLWNHIVDHMIANVEGSQKSLEGYLSTAQPVDLDEGVLTIAVKTEFSKEYIEKHYNQLFKDALLNVLGFPCDTRFITDANISIKMPQTTEEEDVYSSNHSIEDTTAQNTQTDAFSSGQLIQGRQMKRPSEPSHEDNRAIEQKINPKGTYNPRLTFESFVVGENNEFARAAALKVAETPGKSYNPLFIYGAAGLGKTHLLNAIANYVMANYNYMRVIYVTSENFVNDVVAAARYDIFEEFMLKYRAADVLLIDDVQFLEGKDASINALFNTFNELKSRGSAIILSADRPPKELDMDERMRSRFIDGLNVEITAPNFEVRFAILQNYIEMEPEARGLNISDDVLSYIARISTSNIRELDGAIAKIIAHMSLHGNSSIEVEEAQEILDNFFPEENAIKYSVEVIQRFVEESYGITHEELVGDLRVKTINEPRQIAMYLCRTMTDKSYPELGKLFGGRDHTTILHGFKKIETAMKEDPAIYKTLENITAQINDYYKSI